MKNKKRKFQRKIFGGAFSFLYGGVHCSVIGRAVLLSLFKNAAAKRQKKKGGGISAASPQGKKKNLDGWRLNKAADNPKSLQQQKKNMSTKIEKKILFLFLFSRACCYLGLGTGGVLVDCGVRFIIGGRVVRGTFNRVGADGGGSKMCGC